MILPKNCRFAGVNCGIKPDDKDLSVVITEEPCTVAGVYTQNQVRAASIAWNQAITPTANARAIVINSGNANACTGDQGVQDNQQMAHWLAAELNTSDDQILVLSTGVIGHVLPMPKIHAGIKQACESASHSETAFFDCAKGIQTTDRFDKTAFRNWESRGNRHSIVAMAKGAGMIGPNMATLLGIIVADVSLQPLAAAEMLRSAVDQSFNRISVDGHTSTNDAILLMCTGQDNPLENDESARRQFSEMLTSTCIELAKLIPTDGEGASHLIEIQIGGAANDADADVVARTVAASNLVKTAVTGADPNWGRIVSAAGYAGPTMKLEKTNLWLNNHAVFLNGRPTDGDLDPISKSMAENEVCEIRLEIGDGPGKATHWTSDLTVDYVRLNSEYTT